MNRQYSLSFLTVADVDPVAAVTIAAACGYDAVGLRLLPAAASGEAAYPLLSDVGVLKEVQAALADTGVRVADVEIVRLKADYQNAQFEPFLARAQALGAAHVLVAGDDLESARLSANYAQFCALAAGYGLTADLEFMPWTAVKNLRQAQAIVAASGAANAGVLIDALHFYRSDSALAEVAEVAEVGAERIHYIQLCDALLTFDPSDESLIAIARGQRLMPGSGELDLVSLVASVAADTTIGIEVPNVGLTQQYTAQQRAQMGIDQARQVVALSAQD